MDGTTSQALSLSIPVITRWTHKIKVPRWQVWRFCIGSPIYLHSPSEYSALLCQSASSRDQYLISNMASFFRLMSQLPGGRFITLNHFYFEGSLFYWIHIYSVNRFTFLYTCFCPNYHLWTYRIYPLTWYSIAVISDLKRTHFISKWSVKGSGLWNLLVFGIFPTMQLAGLIELSLWRHSDLGSHPATVRWKYLPGWDKVLYWISIQYMVLFLL